jgi:hypothetical protein
LTVWHVALATRVHAPLFHRTLRHLIDRSQDDTEAHEYVGDGEDLAGGGGGGEISVADGGERDDAEVERVQQAPPLDQPVEHGSCHKRYDDEKEEGLKLRIF